MKKLIVGFIIVLSQASFADVSCNLDISLDVDASKINARFLDTPGEYSNIPLENGKDCAENFLLFIKDGDKFADLDGIQLPIEYSYQLKEKDGEEYVGRAAKNAEAGGFELVLDEDATTLKARVKSQE